LAESSTVFSKSNIFLLSFLFVEFQNLKSFFCYFRFIFGDEGLIILSFFFKFRFFLFIFAVICVYELTQTTLDFAVVFPTILLFILIFFLFLL
jgi:hypothetical protein